MQKLAEICIRRPVFAAMMILALVVVGGSSYTRLAVDRFPQVDIPTVSVRTTLPGAGPEEVETLVSDVIEEAVNTVEGIRELRSVSHHGRSTIIVNFELHRNIDSAAQDVRDRVASILRQLPDEVEPPLVSKYDNESTPVLAIALSGPKPIRELTELADKVVKPLIERSSGVGEVQIVGGRERAINIWADADRLAAYKIPINRVATALARQNADIPGGNVTSGTHEQTLRTAGRLTDARAFNDLVIATVNQTPVRISDIGYAEDGTKEERTLARLNGKPAVIMNIRRQSGANTVEAIEGVKTNMKRAKTVLPAGVEVTYIRDQSHYIKLALSEINLHLVLGSVLASLVVMWFTRSWQSTVIAGIAIPVSVIASFGAMEALGFTLNSVTMLALVLMVGIVIDDAIIVVENIFRFIEEKHMGPFEASVEATRDIGMAVLATTLSLAVIFVPVSFMSSISGRFLYQFGITSAVAIMVSLFVSFTLTPMMAARLLKKHGDSTHAESREGFYRHIDRAYTGMLRFSMRHRLAVSALGLLVALSSIPLYQTVRQEYIPTDVDEAEFEVEVNAPEGISVAGMNEVLLQVEKDVREVPGVTDVIADIGGSPMGGSVNRADLFVRVVPHEQRTLSLTRILHGPLDAFKGNYSQRSVMLAVRKKLSRYKELGVRVRNAPSFSLGGGNHEIDFVIRGPELLALAKYTAELRDGAANLGGIVDGDITLKLNNPELRVEIDRSRAADLAVSTRDIAQALRVMVGGEEKVTRFRDHALNEDYDVELRLQHKYRDSAEAISRLFVPRDNGQLVRLDSVVGLVNDTSPTRIDRFDRQRQASLRAGVGPGFALADRIEALREAAREMNMPPAYTTSVSGRARELERTGKEFLIAFALSIAFMYMILASQFENLVHPFTILLSLPLSIPFALLSLWATGNTINLYSALGILVLFGVVKKNSILQIDHMNNLRAHGMPRAEAIIQGNRDRLRPILMTTLALVAGMIPLAVGTGPGAEERRAVAVVVIGGQTLSLLLTLLVTPVAYSLFDDITARAWWRKRLREPQASLGD